MGGRKDQIASKKRKPDSSNNDSTMELTLQLQQLEGELFETRALVDKHAIDIKHLRDSNVLLAGQLQEERYQSQTLIHALNSQEQYSRRNNVRIFGIADTVRNESAAASEDLALTVFNKKLGLDIRPEDVQIAHRTGRYTALSTRSIIVQFVSRKAKKDVIGNRKKLRGSGVSIAEDLTPSNVRRLSAIKSLDCVVQSWSFEGKLFAKNKNGHVKEVLARDLLTEKLFEYPPSNSSLKKPAPTHMDQTTPKHNSPAQEFQGQHDSIMRDRQSREREAIDTAAIGGSTTLTNQDSSKRDHDLSATPNIASGGDTSGWHMIDSPSLGTRGPSASSTPTNPTLSKTDSDVQTRLLNLAKD